MTATITRKTNRPLWTAVRLFAWALAGYGGIVLLMLLLENSMIYAPRPYDGSAVWQFDPADCEDAWFAAADGTKLHGWYLPHPRPKAVVLFAHGNADNVALWSEVGRQWRRELGVSVLVFDYRGYGRSEGKPSEEGLMADARGARGWLAGRAGVPEDEVVLFGRSLGGAVMVDLAAADGARALVLENTFTSLPDVAAIHYPYLPVRTLMRSRFDSLGKIARYRGPLLLAHAEADTIIPARLGRELFAAANEPKEFIEVAAGHNDPQPPEYYDAVRQFLDHLPAQGSTQ